MQQLLGYVVTHELSGLKNGGPDDSVGVVAWREWKDEVTLLLVVAELEMVSEWDEMWGWGEEGVADSAVAAAVDEEYGWVGVAAAWVGVAICDELGRTNSVRMELV